MSWRQWLYSFNGRIGRGRWWAAALLYAAAAVIGAAAVWLFILIVAIQLDSEEEASLLGSVLAAFIGLGVSVSALAVSVKRFHDRGKSGWWILAAAALAVAGSMVAVSSGDPSDPDILGVFILFGVLTWLVVDLGVLRGDPGPNRFGDAPTD